MGRLLAPLAAIYVLVAGLAFAETPAVKSIDPPQHVLLVGNSFYYYNRSLHNHLRDLVSAANPETQKSYTFRSLTVSGARLGDMQGALEEQLKSRKWDIVILQGHSTEPIESDKVRSEGFRAAARRADKAVQDAGAKSAFFMTWAQQDKPEMTRALADGYTGIANEVGALVIPVGLAFERSLKARPDLVLHYRDKVHPSLAGTYLAACTFYAALYRKSPAGLGYISELDPETAKFLQGVAWETVKAFYNG